MNIFVKFLLPLYRNGRRMEGSITRVLKEKLSEEDWMYLAYDRVHCRDIGTRYWASGLNVERGMQGYCSQTRRGYLRIIADCSCPILQWKEKVQDRIIKGCGWCSDRHGVCIIAGETEKEYTAMNFELRHPRYVGSITKNFCVLHIQSNTTIHYFT